MIFIVIMLATLFVAIIILGIKLNKLIKPFKFKIENNYSINTDKNIVRIYYDFSSVPTLYQVFDFINQSKDSKFFILWDRIPNLKDKLKEWKNAEILNHFDAPPITPLIPLPVRNYLAENPDAQFIIHSNSIWFKNLIPILRAIPIKSVKEIHLYEDGSFSATYKMQPRQEAELENFRHTILKKYKVIWHMEDAKLLNSLRCLLYDRSREMKLKYKDEIVVKTSIKELRNKLKENIQLKNDYFNIFGFDYKKFKEEMKHPFGIFVFTLYRQDNFAQAQVKFMNSIVNGSLSYLIKRNKKKIKWFYKEHPALGARLTFKMLMDRQHPSEYTSIDKHLPLELFLIADIIPDYVAGYSSSIFMNLPKHKIIAFIRRDNDPYLYIINRDKLIRKGRIFTLDYKDNSDKSK